MGNASRRKRARRSAPAPPAKRRWAGPLLFGAAAVVGVLIAVGVAWRSAGEEKEAVDLPRADPGPVHIHGLGVNPADGALFIATHSGLFRVAEDSRKAERVGAGRQDTMGFTVVGPNRFLGSGHPDIADAREQDLPPHLGLIESTDAGETWDNVSLLGEADFHVLRFAGKRVFGYDASNDRLLVSADRGRSWDELDTPGPLVDLAVAPLTPGRIVAASAGGSKEGLFESRDGGETWDRIAEVVALLAWPERTRLYLLAGGGQVLLSRDGGRRLEHRGQVGGEPAALLAHHDELYVALHDGTIKRSTDAGATWWTVRSTP